MRSAFADRRVVITGVGLVSPIGNTKDALWQSLCAGRSGVVRLDEFPQTSDIPTFGGRAAEFTGHIDDFGDLEKDQKKMIRKALKLMCRETMMGVAVAQAALQDAGIGGGSHSPERSGCVFGSDYMMTMPEDFVAGFVSCRDDQGRFEYGRWGGEGMSHVTPLWLLKYLPNMPASHVAIYNDLRGPNNSLTLREAASNMAVGEACCTIARGSADMMVAGATGTRIHPMNAIHAIQQEETAADNVTPQQACRPFDRERTGMVLGEGAAAVVLEEFQSAKSRGAPIYGEVVASASSTVVLPNGVADRRQASENVLRMVLAAADAAPSELGHVHAHGISTRCGDADEAQALAAVLADVKGSIPVTAAKSYFGNLGAGSGMVEIIASLLALEHQRLFPILNYRNPDAQCPIRAVTSLDTLPGDNFVTLSMTPQGQTAALIVRRVA